ncbi:MAG: two-component system CheB/CheR fusion protein [Planctomycetota bacterium]|jgi:two-component system CheB/CheR fusion protein
MEGLCSIHDLQEPVFAIETLDMPAKKSVSTKTTTPVVSKEPVVTKSADQAVEAEIAISEFSTHSNQNPRKAFPIVAMGASAGGLEAFESFFLAMPAHSGMAFVLVAHLDPTHESILPALLQKRTQMKVEHVTDGIQIEPNCVYIIPPNAELSILNGNLQLLQRPDKPGAKHTIDAFFKYLAQDQGASAICIILSGTGMDGTEGLKAVKSALGMVMVQDEESAKHNGMPCSAIATGLADYVLRPSLMPAQLVKHVADTMKWGGVNILSQEIPLSQALQKIFVILRARTGHDFSLYKANTISRRLERRMAIHRIDDIVEYVRYLQESDSEAEILLKEFLIGVTNFFRDPEVFHALQADFLPAYLKSKPQDYAVRVWVPGCSSGEEVYSVAIILHEVMELLGRRFTIQIFGTDIDVAAIDVARAGLYPATISEDVEPVRLRRYFTEEDDGRFRVKKMIREMLVFAPQNMIGDPPFTRLDMLCCRNLLIYLGPELQRKLLPMYHYSLKPGGILFLGTSETVGQSGELFSQPDRKHKLFIRTSSSSLTRPAMDFPTKAGVNQTDSLKTPASIQRLEQMSALQMVETILRETKMAPCVIINDACEVVYIHGKTGDFLEPVEGRASMNLLEMARPGLRKNLAAAIREVATTKEETTSRGLKVDPKRAHVTIDLIIKPVLEQTSMHGFMMVVFDEVNDAEQSTRPQDKKRKADRRVKTAEELDLELIFTKESLQTTIEELETANEELKSTNEELQSTNEELQSTNEELETSKEELQSLNEESATVNTELQARINDLNLSNDDMKNLLDSTEIATVFLDTDLNVRRFTPRATDIIPFAPTDVGRPISHLASSLIEVDISEHAKTVLEDLKVREIKVESKDKRVFTMRVRPYRTIANVVQGVVITFEDITKSMRQEKTLQESEKRYRMLFELANDAIVLVDAKTFSIVEYNSIAHNTLGYTSEEFSKLSIAEIEVVKVTSELAKAITKEIVVFDTTHTDKSGALLRVQVKGKAVSLGDRKYILSTWHYK